MAEPLPAERPALPIPRASENDGVKVVVSRISDDVLGTTGSAPVVAPVLALKDPEYKAVGWHNMLFVCN